MQGWGSPCLRMDVSCDAGSDAREQSPEAILGSPLAAFVHLRWGMEVLREGGDVINTSFVFCPISSSAKRMHLAGKMLFGSLL